MKKFAILLTLCLITTISSYAQYGYGAGGYGMGGYGYGRQPQLQSPPPPPRERKVNFIGAVGYFNIDSQAAIEKLKIDDDHAQQQALCGVIDEYNKAREALLEDHRQELDVLEFAKENIDGVQGDQIASRELVKKMSESGRVIKPKMVKIHANLTAEMAKVLSKKVLKRWEKYYKRECRTNNFDPKLKEEEENEEENK